MVNNLMVRAKTPPPPPSIGYRVKEKFLVLATGHSSGVAGLGVEFLCWVGLGGLGGRGDGEVGGWAVGRNRSGDGLHGLFSGPMCLTGSSISLVFFLGRMPCMMLGPWLGFGGPEEGLEASLRISLNAL